MPLSAFPRPVVPVVAPSATPLALLSATAQGLAESGTPLNVALLAIFDAYGYDACELDLTDVAGHDLGSIRRPVEV